MNNQGRNGQIYNTSEDNDQNEDISYISDGAEHFSSTSSLVNTRSSREIFNITNNHSEIELNRTRRNTECVGNNNTSINLNFSSSTPTRIKSHSGSNSSTILNGMDQDVSMHLPLKTTSTQREIGESSSLSVHAGIPTNHNINQGNTIFAPQARRGAFYYRCLLNHHEQSTFNIVGINQLNGLEWVPQINMNQQEYHHSTQIFDLPYASLENQYSSSSTSNAIQVGGNDEQQPHIMRAMMQIELQMRHIQTERGLTEDEIIKCISCGNFEATIEGTSENKELCCICQEEYLTGEEIGKLDCAHIFHMNCIKQWLAEKNICPLCNRRGLFVVGDVIDGC